MKGTYTPYIEGNDDSDTDDDGADDDDTDYVIDDSPVVTHNFDELNVEGWSGEKIDIRSYDQSMSDVFAPYVGNNANTAI
jgi:hypothetical protein